MGLAREKSGMALCLFFFIGSPESLPEENHLA
jgi:hypothetical protein